MSGQKISAPKGVSEYVPSRSSAFEFVRESLIAPAKLAGYHLIELPVFEDTELYARCWRIYRCRIKGNVYI